MAGDNAASQVYVRNKVRACHKVGIESEEILLPANTSEADFLQTIDRLNNSAKTHGILAQLPLPPQINAEKALAAIDPRKDVDGFHAINMGQLVANAPGLRPCTPAGCMTLLRAAGASLRGANAVVLGRSHIVGKPMALMLINAGATVTVCNSQTRDLPEVVKTADILVAAVGKPRFVRGGWIKPGAVVIDVGINRLPDGGLAGDVDFDAAAKTAAAITPVPGGVGRMTIAHLMENTLQAAGL
jgi:methylenetetrahydrofolate dehydrogenase (NADP+)/methenyltetrahydrofolate cyclohydrolase